MTDQEAMRVALACTIDTARGLPLGTETQKRVAEAARVMDRIVRGTKTVQCEATALELVLGKGGPDVC